MPSLKLANFVPITLNLILSWVNKKTIYEVMKDLKHNFEVNERHWGRWAWGSNDKLVAAWKSWDLHEKKQLDNKFWDFIDNQLAALRKDHDHLPEDERREAISK
ncbi:hypothetical protein BDZ97DRAFT_1919332 [Flammula alnicola]|nr:hypothetical protein BDZ97DRAFT_1919332 [Flammula alnicola]